MQAPEWTRLDNAALIYPSSRTKKYASMFRMSVTLDHPVEEDRFERLFLKNLNELGVASEMMTTDGNAVLHRAIENLPIRKAAVHRSKTLLFI